MSHIKFSHKIRPKTGNGRNLNWSRGMSGEQVRGTGTVWITVQDYKSLRAAVAISATEVNQHRQLQTIFKDMHVLKALAHSVH